jgi:hypothetical protein
VSRDSPTWQHQASHAGSQQNASFTTKLRCWTTSNL